MEIKFIFFITPCKGVAGDEINYRLCTYEIRIPKDEVLTTKNALRAWRRTHDVRCEECATLIAKIAGRKMKNSHCSLSSLSHQRFFLTEPIIKGSVKD